jgi:putative MATE family efflux protein
MLKRLIRIGLPSGGEQLAFQGALVLFARLVTGLGTIAFAAHNTVLTIESISFLPGAGFAAAATTLVGQGLGAQDVESARQSGFESFYQAGIFMAAMGVLFIVVPHWFLSLLVSDPQVIDAGVTPLRTVGIIQPLLAASFVFSGALRGAGDTRFPLCIKLISPWLLRLPLAFLLIPVLGLTGAWIALSSDLALQGVLAWWRFRGGRWRLIRV